MRGILVLSLTILTLALFGTAQASALPRVCVTVDHAEAACVYPDEPVFILCADVKGHTVACIPDPCGTTACF